MSIFGRLGTLFKANINDAISKAEDPEKILNQLIIDMSQQLVEAKKQVAVAIADEKRLRKSLDNELRLAADWEAKAMKAVQAGRDDLARQGLTRQQQHKQQADGLQEQWQAQKNASDQLRSQLQQLNNKIEEAKRKKNLLIARSRRAKAQQKIQSTMSGMADDSAFSAFDRMTEKVDQQEAEAEASVEMAGMITGDTLANEFKELDATAGQDDALAALKAKMGQGTPQTAGALPEKGTTGGGEVDSLEAELAALKAKAGTPMGGGGA